MALWTFIQCGWCGFSGFAAPIGDGCPRCGHPLEPEVPEVHEQPKSA
jgi:hypothetical protein